MKSFQMITQQLPTTVKPVKVGSSAGKTRMHPILLPKQTPPPVATGPVMPALSLPPPSVTVTGAIGEKSLPVKSTEILRVPQGRCPFKARDFTLRDLSIAKMKIDTSFSQFTPKRCFV